MKKLLFTGLLASSALFLLGGCGSSNASDASSSKKKKSTDPNKKWTIGIGHDSRISGPALKLSKKSLRISINHKTRSM
ncbi:hypothetical protein EfmAA242_05650 [Enterococcus faecium]|nr:hypothetical protein EfmAA242_05650 [Enterococcus faecium]